MVRFDRPRLGDISGLRGVHLQCHIGTDTLSLSRLGARMSGLDFSVPAITVARDLAASTGADIDFHVADVYDAVDVLGPGGYDLVFTGIGALGWLPDIDRWGQLVADLLRPGGRLFMREGHPVLLVAGRSAARRAGGDRASVLHAGRADGLGRGGHLCHQRRSTFVHTVSHEWNHGLGEVVTRAARRGTGDHRPWPSTTRVPWNARPGEMVETDGEWRMRDRPERFPCTYTLQARKP